MAQRLPPRATMRADHISIAECVRASISADGLVVLDIDGGQVFSANTVGARIWRLLADGTPVVEIARQIAVEYDVSLERAVGDTTAFVAALAARGLITMETEP
jgi:hypothetical protein